jgi:hypothetical protein
MKPSRNVIEQRSRAYVVTYRDSHGRMAERVWSTHEMAVKYAALMIKAGATAVTVDGKAVHP